eukprot:3066663-Rhodomonas_salina.2
MPILSPGVSFLFRERAAIETLSPANPPPASAAAARLLPAGDSKEQGESGTNLRCFGVPPCDCGTVRIPPRLDSANALCNSGEEWRMSAF